MKKTVLVGITASILILITTALILNNRFLTFENVGTTAENSFDAYIKFDGIEGESTDDRHKGWSDVLSFSWGVRQPGLRMGGATGERVNVNDFSFVMTYSKASPKLFLACCTGRHIKTAVLTCCRDTLDRKAYLNYTFNDVMITSYETVGNTTYDRPTEEVAITFSKILIEYQQYDSEGKPIGPLVRVGWDFKKGKPS